MFLLKKEEKNLISFVCKTFKKRYYKNIKLTKILNINKCLIKKILKNRKLGIPLNENGAFP